MAKKSTIAEAAADIAPGGVTHVREHTLLDILLDMRAELRGERLSKTFNIPNMSTFDAFSIHVMAGTIEVALNERGVLTEFQTLKWEKGGNQSVIEGRLDLVHVSTGEMRSYSCVGEGVDKGDKGLGKALSSARKAGFIQAFNLAVGIDIENDATVREAGPKYGNTTSAIDDRNKPYTLIGADGQIETVAPADLLNKFMQALARISTLGGFEAFIKENADVANRLERGSPADKAILATLEVAINDKQQHLSGLSNAA